MQRGEIDKLPSKKVKIVTDSTAYLLLETIERYDIRVVPLRVTFGTEAYAEGLDITNEEFYQKLAKSSRLPTTSQPPVSDFIRVYSELVQDGHPIFSIHISGKLSGTINSALAAREAFPQAEIEVVDWLSDGFGLVALAAARAAEEGQGLAQIKATVKQLVARMSCFGVLGSLEYLRKGGRIGGARALAGSLLRIKPILALKGGDVKVLAKVRTEDKAIECMLELVRKRMEGSTFIHGAVVHTRALEGALKLEEAIRARFNCAELSLVELGPVLGTHTGPGLLGLGFYGDGEQQIDDSE